MIPTETISKKKDAQVTREKISDKTLAELEEAIDAIDDPQTQHAFREMAHVLTGSDKFETQS